MLLFNSLLLLKLSQLSQLMHVLVLMLSLISRSMLMFLPSHGTSLKLLTHLKANTGHYKLALSGLLSSKTHVQKLTSMFCLDSSISIAQCQIQLVLLKSVKENWRKQ